MTEKISRAQWQQIAKRVHSTSYTFDPSWKCLIDGQRYSQCMEHGEEEQRAIIAEVIKRETVNA